MAQNETYKTILSALHGTENMWKKVSKDLSLITVRKLPKKKKKESTSSYMLFYNGIFTGCFIKEQYINLDELAETGWKYEGEFDLFA